MLRIRNISQAELDKLKNCKKCNLWTTRRQVVIGRGSIPARLLFIGEAPGKSEDLAGEAFIGKAGKLLDTMLEDACKIGLSIPLIMPDFCILNAVLCHPTNTFAGPNRQPTKEEAFACLSNITFLIEKVQPERVVLVGDIASTYFRKEFPEAAHITHPQALEKKGGTRAPNYLYNVRILQDVIKSLQPQMLRRIG